MSDRTPPDRTPPDRTPLDRTPERPRPPRTHVRQALDFPFETATLRSDLNTMHRDAGANRAPGHGFEVVGLRGGWTVASNKAPELWSSADTTKAHPARVYDYWLGGKDHFAADRMVAERAAANAPEVTLACRENRA